jgi:hypothetical protein
MSPNRLDGNLADGQRTFGSPWAEAGEQRVSPEVFADNAAAVPARLDGFATAFHLRNVVSQRRPTPAFRGAIIGVSEIPRGR